MSWRCLHHTPAACDGGEAGVCGQVCVHVCLHVWERAEHTQRSGHARRCCTACPDYRGAWAPSPMLLEGPPADVLTSGGRPVRGVSAVPRRCPRTQIGGGVGGRESANPGKEELAGCLGGGRQLRRSQGVCGGRSLEGSTFWGSVLEGVESWLTHRCRRWGLSWRCDSMSPASGQHLGP